MIRLHFVVEGQTEETFVNQVLSPYLSEHDVVCDARCVLTSRQGYRQFKGGVSSYQQIRRDISLWVKEDRNSDARFTTLFDLYRLPATFPEYAESRYAPDPYRKVTELERAFAADLADNRLIPHLQLHEFEALLFSDIDRLILEFPAAKDQIARLKAETGGYTSPELIADGPETAPSKRIIKRYRIMPAEK